MFQKPDEEVAAEVGVSIETIVKWRLSKEFQRALASGERAIRAAAARITSDASLIAAKNLHNLLSNGADGKLSLDTLKASSAFAEREEEPKQTLEDVIREVTRGDESGD